MSYTLRVKNGVVLTGLKVSGTCFETEQAVSGEMFASGPLKMSIEGIGEDAGKPSPYGLGEVEGWEFERVFESSGKYVFYFTRLSEEELARLQDRADIEYIAMMTGVEL